MKNYVGSIRFSTLTNNGHPYIIEVALRLNPLLSLSARPAILTLPALSLQQRFPAYDLNNLFHTASTRGPSAIAYLVPP